MKFLARIGSLFEGVAIAVQSIRSNKVRAGLTILGVAIGVFAVVVISAAIHGINASIAHEFEKAGPTTFFVNRYPITLEACDGSDDTCRWLNNPPLLLSEAAAIQRLASVQNVTVQSGLNASLKNRDRQLPSVNVSAFSGNWIESDGGDVVEGRNFTSAEDMSASPVVLINHKAAERLFGESDPIGKDVTVRETPFQIIGIYESGASFMGDGDRPRAWLSFSAARRYLNADPRWIQFTVKPRPESGRDETIDDVIAVMRGSRGLHPAMDNNFAIITQDKLFETFGRLTGVFFLVMIALSGVGLLVGGVGVVAIMMISVTERTREIGVRKALGATRSMILWQFLVEAATLTVFGALAGLAVGWGVAAIVRSSTPIPAEVPPMAIVSALVASALTGVVFGMFPASRAARLDPVEALRYE